MLKSFAIASAAALLGPAIGVAVFFASNNDQSESTSESLGTERFMGSGEAEVIGQICLKGWSADFSSSRQSWLEALQKLRRSAKKNSDAVAFGYVIGRGFQQLPNYLCPRDKRNDNIISESDRKVAQGEKRLAPQMKLSHL